MVVVLEITDRPMYIEPMCIATDRESTHVSKLGLTRVSARRLQSQPLLEFTVLKRLC